MLAAELEPLHLARRSALYLDDNPKTLSRATRRASGGVHAHPQLNPIRASRPSLASRRGLPLQLTDFVLVSFVAPRFATASLDPGPCCSRIFGDCQGWRFRTSLPLRPENSTLAPPTGRAKSGHIANLSGFSGSGRS